MLSATSIVKKSDGGDEAVHGFEADMVGVHMVAFFPAERGHGVVGLGAEAGLSAPMKECSRLDLFQTGMNSAPSAVALTQAAKLRVALMARSGRPCRRRISREGGIGS